MLAAVSTCCEMTFCFFLAKSKVDDCHIVYIKQKMAAANEKTRIVETGNTKSSSDEDSDSMVAGKSKTK
jgi:hypothetical protein